MLYALKDHKKLLAVCATTKARTPFCSSSSTRTSVHAEVSSDSLASCLRWCTREKSLAQGMQAHHHLIKSGLEKNTFLGNLCLRLYCSCNAFQEASALFCYMDQKNEFTWRTMIVALIQGGHIKQAFELFEEMLSNGAVPDRLTFIAVITGYCSQGRLYLEKGYIIHYLLIIFRMDVDATVGNVLISMYGKNDSISDARGTFDFMPSRDVVSWNAMITIYAKKGHCDEAATLFKVMESIHDNTTFIAILTAIDSPSDLEFGIHVHNLVIASKYKSMVAVSNALIHMYGRCASLKGAEEAFEQMQEQNTITWTTMLAVYSEHGDSIQAFQFYEQMLQECMMPNIVTFVTYLNLCTKKEALTAGKQVHACTACNQRKDEVIVDTALVNMYGKCGCIKMAHKIFDGMPQRNVVSWGTIISIHVQHTLAKDAIQLLQQMQQEGELPDRVVYLSILDAYSSQLILKGGQQVQVCVMTRMIHLDVSFGTALIRFYGECFRLRDAEDIFNSLLERNVFSWNALTTGYLQIEESELILSCFNRMQEEAVLPDDVTFVNTFSACGVVMKLLPGKWMHALFVTSEFVSNVILWNALISMYGRCCSLRQAQRVFETSPIWNTISWNAMMAAFAQNGCTKEALSHFRKMEAEGFRAESSTFSVVLSACSHGGLVNEAFHAFVTLVHDLGIKPQVDHYNCVIDLLARAGRLDEAENLLKTMPCKFNFVSLMTLLAPCRLQSDIDRAKQIASRACLIDPSNGAPLVMLSNIYAAIDSFAKVRRDFN